MNKGDQAFRSDNPKDVWEEMTYAGALSFMRRPYTRAVDHVDLVISGIPYDCATTYRPGCRFGPKAIRENSVQLTELEAFPYGFNPFETLSVIDYGDCYINPHQPQTIASAIEQHADNILKHSSKMLTLGGDHFITYPLLKAHAKKYGPIALIQFDAHCDTWEDEPNRLDHGTMFARAVDEGVIDVARSIQVGLRTYNNTDYGFEILTAPWVHKNGIDATIQKVIQRVGNAPVYLTFDVDGLDPAFAPGTGTPVVGGLATWQALAFVQGLKDLNLIGMDVVEVSPPYDHSDITAIAAATVAYQWLCLLALKNGAKPNPVGHL